MSFSQPVLEWVARRAARRPRLALFASLLTCAVLAAPIASLRLDPDPVNMLPRDAGPMQRLNELVTVFGSGDQLFLAIERQDGAAPDEQQLAEIRAVVETLAAEVSAWRWHNPATGEPEDMMGLVVGSHDPAMEEAIKDLVGSAGFLALPDDDATIDALIRKLHPKRVARALKRGPPPEVASHPSWSRRDLLGIWNDLYRPQLDLLEEGDLPLRNDGGYLCTPDRSVHVLMLNPLLPIKNMAFTHAIADKLRELETGFHQHPEWRHLKLHVAGGYLLADADFRAVRESAILTLLTSIAGITLLFGCVYRSLRLITFIAVAVMPAIGAAIGLATLAFGGTLSLMVSAFSAVLVGLGVDYVIHVFNAYSWSLKHQEGAFENQRARRTDAAIQAIHRVGPGILLGCVTSVASFSILGLSDFRGLRELGLVTACGLTCIFLLLLIVTPALLSLWGPDECREPRLLSRYTELFGRRPRRFVVISVALAVFVGVVLSLAPKWFVFDRDLRNLRPDDTTGSYQAYVDLGRRLGIDFAGLELLFRSDDLLSLLDQSSALYAAHEPLRQGIPCRFEADLELADLRAGLGRLPAACQATPEELLARHVIASPWGRIHFARYAEGAFHELRLIDPEQVDADDPTVLPAGSEMVITPILRPGSPSASQLQALPAPSHQRRILQAMETVDWPAIRAAIEAAEEPYRERYAPFIHDLLAMAERVEQRRLLLPDDLAGTPLAQLVDQVLARSDSGTWYMRLPVPLTHDRSYIPIPELQAALGFETAADGSGNMDNDMDLGQQVDASLIGGSALEFYIQKMVIDNFVRLTGVAAVVTVFILLIAMRNLASVAITIGTLLAGIALMLACMHVLGLKWTILNICVLPLIIGIGIDNGIHFLHHLARQDRSHNGLMRTLLEIGYPIYMTALTSIVGFGSLLLNAYRGVQDLGLLASIGILACLVTTILVLPTILIWTRYKPPPDAEQDPRSRVMPSVKLPGSP